MQEGARALDGLATASLGCVRGRFGGTMERRELLAVSAAVLALAPLRSLQAQTQTPGSIPPAPAAPAATPAAAATSSTPAAAAAAAQPFTAAQLDQLVAPIALYP